MSVEARLKALLEKRIVDWPLLVVAVLGGALAWPVAGLTAWQLGFILLGTLAVALGAISPGDGEAPRGKLPRVGVAFGASGLGAAALLQRLDQPGFGLMILLGVAASLFHVEGLFRGETRPEGGEAAPSTLVACIAGSIVLFAPDQLGVEPAWALGLLVAVFVGQLIVSSGLRAARERAEAGVIATFAGTPARFLIVSFAMIGFVGTLLLLLPAASASPAPLTFVNAAFTALSATCVTGLAVLDTAKDFSTFGQVIILLLIQVGGLGIMTLGTAAAVFAGRRLGLKQENLAAEILGGGEVRGDMAGVLKRVLLVTFVTELSGALTLALLFWRGGDGPGVALWRGVFTAISAFCNAGFALQSDSLVPYQGAPGVLLTVSALITVGGLGPLVVLALPALARGRGDLQIRLVVLTSLILTLAPFLLYLTLEWNQTLEGMGFVDRLVNGLFQSVTLRTAGFNSVDLSQVRPATLTLMMICMFIGGSPGSTAGGVKTTTVAVLLATVWAGVRGRRQTVAFGRRVTLRVVGDALAIVTAGILSLFGVLVALQVTQAMRFEVALFEAVSALGTVGLSIGGTAELDGVGKVIIILAMFAGRVGPLSVFVFFTQEAHSDGPRHPEGRVQVG